MKNLAFYPGDGRHTGYCTRCGGDVFNGRRHHCPKGIKRHACDVIIAAKQFVDAELAFGSSSAGTLSHRAAENDRADKFAILVRCIAVQNEASTIKDHPETAQ